MFKHSNVQMFKCSNVQMFKCPNVQLLKCSNAPMFKYAKVQMFKFSNFQMFTCQMSIRLNFCRSVPPEFLRSFFVLFRGDKWTDEKNDFFSSILPTRFDFHFHNSCKKHSNIIHHRLDFLTKALGDQQFFCGEKVAFHIIVIVIFVSVTKWRWPIFLGQIYNWNE